MDKYSKRAITIFRILGLVVIAIGLVMMAIRSSASGRVGGEKFNSGNFASLTGFQIIIVGLIMLLISLLFIGKRSEE